MSSIPIIAQQLSWQCGLPTSYEKHDRYVEGAIRCYEEHLKQGYKSIPQAGLVTAIPVSKGVRPWAKV
jgi:hypothetical protein